MSAKTDIQSAIYKWCNQEFPSVDFQFPYQNFAVPATGLFGLITILSVASIAPDEAKYSYQEVSDIMTESVGGPRKVLASLTLYRDGAYDTLSQLKASLRRQNIINLLWNNGLSVVEASDIRDISELISSTWEEQFQMDVTFYTNSQYDSTIERIQIVPIKGYVEGELKIDIEIDGDKT